MINTDDDPLGILNDIGDVSPITSLPPPGVKEHRNETRYSAAWKVTIAADGLGSHDGRVRDISLHGAAILIGRNLKPGISVTLHFHMHSLTGPGAPKILVVHGIICYTTHDANALCFRVGVTFSKFETASDRVYLEDRLTNHHSRAI